METDKDRTARDDNGQPAKHRASSGKSRKWGGSKAQVMGQHPVGTAGITRPSLEDPTRGGQSISRFPQGRLCPH